MDRTLYQFLSDLSECIRYGTDESLICDKPTHWFTMTKPDCAWEIFNHVPRTDCNMKDRSPETFVLGISKNQFIFVLEKSIKITIICKDIANHDWLSGEGVLTLEPQCTLTADNIQLNSNFDFTNNSEIIIPKLDIINDWILAKRPTTYENTSFETNKTIDLRAFNLMKLEITYAFN